MSEFEALELVGMHIGQIDTAFEFWLTISFAVLVALHIVRESISRQLKLLLCCLYVSATLVLLFNTFGDYQQIQVINEAIENEPSQILWNQLATTLRFFVYIAGTISVSVAIFRYDKWVGQHDT